jgi:hypothetical protein
MMRRTMVARDRAQFTHGEAPGQVLRQTSGYNFFIVIGGTGYLLGTRTWRALRCAFFPTTTWRIEP